MLDVTLLDGVMDADCPTERDALALEVWLGVCDAVTVDVALVVAVLVGDCVRVALGDPDAVRDDVAVVVTVGVTEDVGEGVDVGVDDG